MPSRILPAEEIAQLGTQFWLPSGGQDNGLDATSWTVIAELDADEVSPALSELANAGVGAYAAARTGLTSQGRTPVRRLYVDAMQWDQAVDALMLFMRGKQIRDLGGYVPNNRAPAKETTAAPARRPAVRIAVRTAKILAIAAGLALAAAVVYQSFVDRYAEQHPPAGHPPPAVHQPVAPVGPAVRS